jgi:hypothetical protein
VNTAGKGEGPQPVVQDVEPDLEYSYAEVGHNEIDDYLL